MAAATLLSGGESDGVSAAGPCSSRRLLQEATVVVVHGENFGGLGQRNAEPRMPDPEQKRRWNPAILAHQGVFENGRHSRNCWQDVQRKSRWTSTP
jgi:hypothetical protein